MQIQLKNYAPFGLGDPTNQYWVHAGSYTAPFGNLEQAQRYARQQFHSASTYIRDRSGRLLWSRGIDCKETTY